MAANRFSSPIDLGIPAIPGDSLPKEFFEDFYRLYTAINQLHMGLVQYTGASQQPVADWPLLTPADTLYAGNVHRLYIEAAAAISYGQLVNLYNVGGVLKARLAGAGSASLYCNAICSTLGGIAVGEFGEVLLLEGLVEGLSGLTPGALYYLSPSVSGAYTTTRPSTAGQIIQPIGVGLSATNLYFDAQLAYIQL